MCNLLEARIIPDKPEKVTDKDIIRCRDYYGIDIDGLIKFGSWIVNRIGDIVNADRDYSVFENQIRIDGTLVKRMPLGGRELYLFRERHGISSKMIEAIREEAMMLNDSIKKKVFNRDGKICTVCGSTENLCVDHILPVSRGGFTQMNNLQVLCEKCNLQKSNMNMDEFYIWRINHVRTT